MKTFSITDQIDHTHVRFDSFADYVAASAQPNPNPYPTESFTASNSFTAYTTLTDARNFMASGWPKGAERIRAVSECVQQAIPDTVLAAHRPVQVWDVTGLSLDVATFLDGQPECFIDEIVPERGDRIDGNGIVRITVNLSASCGVRAKELETRGVFAAALSDVLELLGYRVQIDGFFCDKSKHINAKGKLTDNLHVLQFPIKRADEALEIDRLSFVLAHPASLRQIGFHVQDVVGYRDGVYGHPRKLLAPYLGDINIGELAWRSNSDVDTANKVLAELKALGIDLGIEAL